MELRKLLRTALESATKNTGQAAIFLVIGLIGALYVSANVMGSLVGGLDRVRGVPHRPWVRGKLAALVIAIATSVLVVATTLALIGGSRLVESVAEAIFGKGAPNVAGRVLYLIGTASLLVFTIAVYHFGPNAPAAAPAVRAAGCAGRRRAVGRRHAPLRDLHRELRFVQDGLRGAGRRRHLPHLPVPHVRLAADRRRGQRADLRHAPGPAPWRLAVTRVAG